MQLADSLLSPEARLLLLALDRGEDKSRLKSQADDPSLDWNRLVMLAQREKATAQVWKTLAPVASTVPEERQRQLGMLTAVNEFRMRHHQARLLEVVKLLDGIGIPVVLLKGAGLAASTYGSFVERPMYDLDLLIRPEDAQRGWDALREAGWTHNEEECPAEFYKGHYHLPPVDDPSGTGLAVELHTRPWQAGVELSAEAMWRDARKVSFGGQEVLVPSAAHQILHLATHFAWTHMLTSGGWRTMRDLGQILATDEVDWKEFVALARESNGSSCCYWTFDIARTLANAPVPDEVMRALRPPLPSPMLNVLRKHYIAAVFHFSPNPCPSLRLGRMMWTAGHAPGMKALNGARPWMRDAEWAEHAHAAPPLAFMEALRNQLADLRKWTQYLGALLTSSHKRTTASAK